ncbi:MAG: hypothetical protein HQL70_06445 [Magnetococcales bacterium]|nr:hypothetical protein [Magnetococcales bacterium]
MFSTSGLSIDQAPPLHLPMRFFATGPFFLLLAGLTSIFFAENLLLTPLMPETVALVHLAVLGWILMTMFGAMYQMIPVLASITVPKPGLIPWVHSLLIMGVVTMALGIATDIHPWMLLFASLGLGGSIALFVIPIAIALYKTPTKHPTVTAMRISLISLIGVLAMGALFLGEYSHGFYDFNRQALVGVHLIWGLFGWVGTLIIGVSFQVLPMFYMTQEFCTKRASTVLKAWGASLLLIPQVLFFTPENTMLLVGASIPGVLALVIYGVTIKNMLGNRKRVRIDLTYRFWMFGFTAAFISLVLMACWPVIDDEKLRIIFGIFFILGWATSILFGMLYKIIPFLVWFHRFSRMAGLVKIPMMDDLMPEKLIKLHFPLHLLTTATFILAAFFDIHQLTMLAGGGLIISGGILAYSIWFALSIVPPEAPEVPDFESFFKDMEKKPVDG